MHSTDRRFLALSVGEPVGVCAQIIPWNYPLLMASWKVGPALAAGCTIVLKPAEQTPLSALRLAELALEAGLPAGVLSVVTGDGGTGSALASHPLVRKVAFTGSTEVGRLVMSAGAATIKRITLELGGKNPNVIFADADLEAALTGAIDGAFENMGQACIAGSRLLVERSIEDQVVEALAQRGRALKVGPGWEDDVRTWDNHFGDDAHANRRGNVIRMNLEQLHRAYGLTKDMRLPEDAEMKALRLRYPNTLAATRGPRVSTGANLATEVFWHGTKMDAWAHRWVAFETDGVAHLGTTAMNDSGAMLALQALTQQGKADWNRALLLRTASNFDQQPPGVTAAESFETERHGAYTAYLPALEAAYTVGHRVVAEWLK